MIEGLAFAIAASGATLLLILYARIRAVDAELKLKKHRSKAPTSSAKWCPSASHTG